MSFRSKTYSFPRYTGGLASQSIDLYQTQRAVGSPSFPMNDQLVLRPILSFGFSMSSPSLVNAQSLTSIPAWSSTSRTGCFFSGIDGIANVLVAVIVFPEKWNGQFSSVQSHCARTKSNRGRLWPHQINLATWVHILPSESSMRPG